MPVTIPETESRTIPSLSGHMQYELLISKPLKMQTGQKYPAIYLLDADACFGSMVESIRMRCHRPDATNVIPAIVVGISHRSAGSHIRENRSFDFTMSPSMDELSVSSSMGGGAKDFLYWMETRLKPEIEKDFPIDPAQQTLFGHSLGAYFVLLTAMSTSSTFRNYISVSPSIWWNPLVLHKKMEAFLTMHPDRYDHLKKLLLYTGEYEESLAPWQELNEKNLDSLQRRKRRAMIGNTQDLVRHLNEHASHIFDVSYQHVPHEDHASLVSVAINRSLRTVLSPSVTAD